jgi:hypothetical protein
LRAAALCTLCLALTASGTAGADESPARALLEQGIALRREGRDEDALPLFEAANRIAPSPCARAQIGLAKEALHRWLDAEASLQEALASPQDPWVERHRDSLVRALDIASTHLGWIQVRVDPRAARVLVNGREGPADGTPSRVEAGSVSLVVGATDYRSEDRVVSVDPGAVIRSDVVLNRALPQETAATSEEPLVLERAARPQAAANSETLGPERDRRSTDTRWLVAAPLFAVGAIAAGLGTWSGLEAIAAARTRNAHCSDLYCDPPGLAADRDARRWSTLSTVGLGVGTAAVVAGAAWLLLAPRSRVRPLLTGGSGLGLWIEADL